MTVFILLRWVAIGAAAPIAVALGDGELSLAGLVLVMPAAARSWRLKRTWSTWWASSLAMQLVELVLACGVVAATGGWRSPWTLAPVVVAAGIGHQLPTRWAGSVAAASLILVLLVGLVSRSDELVHGGVASLILLGIIGLVVAYGSWIVTCLQRQRMELAAVNDRLAATNALLVGLDHSASGGEGFDQRRCARSIAGTVGTLLAVETIVVLGATALTGRWQLLHAEGASVSEIMDDSDLPALAQATSASQAPAHWTFVMPAASMSGRSKSGMVIPVHLHGRMLALILLEDPDPERFADVDDGLVQQLAQRAALMLDNARRFSALWVVGATEERTRVAHNLHDRLGQSLAALGLELDILVRSMTEEPARSEIRVLRQQVTGMVGELRDTMRELRLDVSEQRPLSEALGSLARDLGRHTVEIELVTDERARLSLAQEHQLLLIARHALTAAMVDAEATHIEILWRCDGVRGELTVQHDGNIQDVAGLGTSPAAAYIEAMDRVEGRCSAIGARLRTDATGIIACEVG